MKKPSLRLPGREGAPSGLWGSRPQLSLDGDRTLVVEHHQGILDYGPEEVLVAAGGLRIRVKGRDLRLAAMDGDGLCLCGQIREIAYEIREGPC